MSVSVLLHQCATETHLLVSPSSFADVLVLGRQDIKNLGNAVLSKRSHLLSALNCFIGQGEPHQLLLLGLVSQVGSTRGTS